MYNFFYRIRCFFTGFLSLIKLEVLANIFIALIGFILIVSLLIYPSLLLALALFLLFLWAIIF